VYPTLHLFHYPFFHILLHRFPAPWGYTPL
jgi:hypothetical protein